MLLSVLALYTDKQAVLSTFQHEFATRELLKANDCLSIILPTTRDYERLLKVLALHRGKQVVLSTFVDTRELLKAILIVLALFCPQLETYERLLFV